jgi:hypothetical protein
MPVSTEQWEWHCSNGHEMMAPSQHKLRRCPHYVNGLPCRGRVERAGEGSIKEHACAGSGLPAEPIRKDSKKGRCPHCGKKVALTRGGKLYTHENGAERPPEPVEEPDEEVTITISGSAFQIVSDGNWRKDNPRGWKALNGGVIRPRGKGHQVTFTILREDADDLSNYLSSVADVVGSMTTEERNGGREHIVATKAWETIQAALS